jgi:hypothetical protein
MPIEYVLLRDRSCPLAYCPKCGDAPFQPFMRGQVRSGWRAFWHAPAWSLICSHCKRIVGHEETGLDVVDDTLRRRLYEFVAGLRRV